MYLSSLRNHGRLRLFGDHWIVILISIIFINGFFSKYFTYQLLELVGQQQ